jgi:hypothetical protein
MQHNIHYTIVYLILHVSSLLIIHIIWLVIYYEVLLYFGEYLFLKQSINISFSSSFHIV